MTLDGFSVNMVPSQEELWDPMPVEAYEFTRNFAEACADPLVVRTRQRKAQCTNAYERI